MARAARKAGEKRTKNRSLHTDMPPWRTDPLRIGKVMSKEEAKEARRMFLIALKNTGIESQACRLVGIVQSQISRWKANLPKFADKVDLVKDEFVDSLESIAIERAKDKSDSLLLAMLRAHRPEKYHDKTRSDINMTHLGDKNAPVQVVFSRDEVGEADVPTKDTP